MDIYPYFTRAVRDDGTTYTTLTDEHPDWLHDAVYEAHDDELPNDWRYETCAQVAEAIDEGDTDASTIADSLTDIYNADLLAWVSGNLGRMSDVDEAMEDGSHDSLASLLMAGQYRCIERMAQILLDAVDEAEEDES
jgi:hypothetical protein